MKTLAKSLLLGLILSICAVGTVQARIPSASADNQYVCPGYNFSLVVRVGSNGVFCRTVNLVMAFQHYDENFQQIEVIDSVTLNRLQSRDFYLFDGLVDESPEFSQRLISAVNIEVLENGHRHIYIWQADEDTHSSDAHISMFFLEGRSFYRWNDNVSNNLQSFSFVEEMSADISLALDLLEQYPKNSLSFENR